MTKKKSTLALEDGFKNMLQELGVKNSGLRKKFAKKLVKFAKIWDNDPDDTQAIELAQKEIIKWFKQNYKK